MKQISLKLGIFLLTFFSFLSVSAYDFEVDGLYYTITSLKDLTVSVDGCVNKDTTNIVIPQTVEYKGKTLTVTSAGKRVFYKFEKLQSVMFPKMVSSIGAEAFEGDSLLTDVVLPDSLSSIGYDAFAGTSINEIQLPNSLIKIGAGAFRETNIRCIKFPNGVIDIPSSCFENCDSLKNIQWPKNLKSIGDHAFDGCRALVDFTIPSGVVKISPSIIWNCSNISKLIVGTGLEGFPFECVYYKDYSLEKARSLFDSHLNIDTIIIEDSYNEFSLKGRREKEHYSYYIAPAFGYLRYFYVGRPLIDITEWYPTSSNYNLDKKFFVDNRYYRDSNRYNINKLEIAGTCTEVPYFYQEVDTLILGENIETFNVQYFHSDHLTTIICKSKTPPNVTGGSLSTKVYTDGILYVPKGCIDVYSKNTEWGLFWTIKEYDENETGIMNAIDVPKDITISTEKGSIRVNNVPLNSLIQVYNLQGMLIAKSYESIICGLAKGSYIVTVGGKTFKVAL